MEFRGQICFRILSTAVLVCSATTQVFAQDDASSAADDKPLLNNPDGEKADTEDGDKKASTPAAEDAAEKKKSWRRDPSVPRRPGSYLGGGFGYSMLNARYTVTQKDLVEDYNVGPSHGSVSFIRVGDAFFEWFAAGFQIDIISATFAGKDSPGGAAFGLYVDTTFYPWRGLGLRPCVGVGFGYAQVGKESYELGFGGPLTLSFAATYEFRVSRFFTMGPVVQVSWIKGEDFDAVFFNVGLELLKWFRTAEG